MLRKTALTLALALAALPTIIPTAAFAESAIFAGGCFWCVEADFDKVPGVTATTSGYAGGSTKNPTYENYASGGHLEVVKIDFDPAKVSYAALVDAFFRSVDPTDAGGQFCDRGKSYSTAIYALNPEQTKVAGKGKAAANTALGGKVVTPVLAKAPFWPAEDYHQNYYKSSERTLTRFGYVSRAEAYKGYRQGCGRDQTVKQVWGKAAYEGIPGH
ncbi:peptide-methionine (S)-S-oxide reductase MsrA [Mesorhizobium sp. NBSH29]|uniref:peptide-methionine (S)-S-oxide reductase MsrA n=1 Tax=Mesorhizobium sp. NBSH29 TaxID=2654249 RepID=UPI00189695CE|nr:peptide-methionine (S)-S-oxide reductase MsrA [Mesorhizobium sp. NBSH29]QPC86053.1 peptide-methionine (S)-S-oxide reductase MsrA [Mesorhizobium sp. NBSH29]